MVYAEPGTANQQIGGEIPVGWVAMIVEKGDADVVATVAGEWVSRIPSTVSRFQGREAMWQTPHGDTSLFEAAEAVINDPATPAMYRRAWADLQEFRRDSEMLIAIAATLGLTAQDLDNLFIFAASLKA